jgi:hypothetical protein
MERFESIPIRNLPLKRFHLRIFEFHDRAASGTDQVIVMLAKMHVLVPDMAIIEAVFPGKAQTVEQAKGVLNEFRRVWGSPFFEQADHVLAGHMVLGLEKGVHDLKPVLVAIDLLLLQKLSALFPFTCMQLFHHLS